VIIKQDEESFVNTPDGVPLIAIRVAEVAAGGTTLQANKRPPFHLHSDSESTTLTAELLFVSPWRSLPDTRLCRVDWLASNDSPAVPLLPILVSGP
jgi:hypothetical protein